MSDEKKQDPLPREVREEMCNRAHDAALFLKEWVEIVESSKFQWWRSIPVNHHHTESAKQTRSEILAILEKLNDPRWSPSELF